MTQLASTRQRPPRPSDQRRAELQAAQRCITCKRPSKTQRCPTCSAEVEANTARYHGQGRQGPKTSAENDSIDLRHAMESLARGAAGFAEVARADLSARRRVEALAEPLAQLGLCERLVRGVRRRNHRAEEALRRPVVPPPAPPQLVFAFFRAGAMGAR